MDLTEEREYTVELTPTSRRYFYEVLDYVYQYHSLERAEEIARKLKEAAKNLKQNQLGRNCIAVEMFWDFLDLQHRIRLIEKYK